MSVDTYYSALEISEDTDFQIHLRRPPSFYFINNYFQLGLKAWDANIDIQHVVNNQFFKQNRRFLFERHEASFEIVNGNKGQAIVTKYEQ